MPGQILYVLCAVVRNTLPMITLISGSRNAWLHMKGDWQEALQPPRGSSPADLTSYLRSLGQWHLKYVFADKRSWKFSNQIRITFVHSNSMCVCIYTFLEAADMSKCTLFCFSFYPWIKVIMRDSLTQSIVLGKDEKVMLFHHSHKLAIYKEKLFKQATFVGCFSYLFIVVKYT